MQHLLLPAFSTRREESRGLGGEITVPCLLLNQYFWNAECASCRLAWDFLVNGILSGRFKNKCESLLNGSRWLIQNLEEKGGERKRGEINQLYHCAKIISCTSIKSRGRQLIFTELHMWQWLLQISAWLHQNTRRSASFVKYEGK